MFTSSASISLSVFGELLEQRKIHKCIKVKIAMKANGVDALPAVLQMTCMSRVRTELLLQACLSESSSRGISGSLEAEASVV